MKHWGFFQPYYQITVTCFCWQSQFSCRRVIYRLLSQEKDQECSLALHDILLIGDLDKCRMNSWINAESVGRSAWTELLMPFMSHVKVKPWDIVVLDIITRITGFCSAYPFTSHSVAFQCPNLLRNAKNNAKQNKKSTKNFYKKHFSLIREWLIAELRHICCSTNDNYLKSSLQLVFITQCLCHSHWCIDCLK